MSLRPSEIALVGAEIARVLAGRTVQKVVTPDARTIVLGFPHAWLYVVLDPRDGRVHLADAKPAGTGEAAPPMCMLLRKELIGLGLQSVDIVAGERALGLRFVGRGAASGVTRALLVFVYGAGARAVLVDDRGLPLGALGGRWPDPGEPVTLPPPRALPPERDPPSRFPASEISIAIAAHYAIERDRGGENDARAQALGELRREDKRLARLVENLAADQARVAGAERMRRCADLLLAHLGEVPRGAAEITLPDDFDDGAPITIALDPSRSPQQNAAHLYHGYRRLQRGRATVAARLASARAQLAATRDLSAQVATVDAAGLGALTRLRPARRVSTNEAPSARSREPEKKPPYRCFVSSSGAEILVGKGADKNDQLTFHVARGNDLWLHARDLPGAHVVVPLGGRPIDEATLLDAATLAVWFSPARPASSLDVQSIRQVQADVTYVQRKLVRKPKNAGPGRVAVAGGKTIRIRLEPDRVQRLLATRAND